MAGPRARRLARWGFVQDIRMVTLATIGWLRDVVTGIGARKRSTKAKVKAKISQGRWP